MGTRNGSPRYVFVLGTGRCGSTMVQELLAHHPEVGFVSNVDNLLAVLDLSGRWNSDLYRLIPTRYTRRDAAYLKHLRYTLSERLHFGPSEAYRLIARHVSPLVVAPARDLRADDVTPWLARRLRALFEERAARQGSVVLMHKFTGWPRARFLDAVFPQARFVHVLRDGRAVASSIMQRPWWRGYAGPTGWGLGPLEPGDDELWRRSDRSFVVLAGLEWKMLMAAFDECRAAIDASRWIDVRYEDFVADPRPVVERLLEFCGLGWTPAFERKFAKVDFTRQRLDAFRRDLTPTQLADLERAIGPDLQRLGYPVGTVSTSA